ncbi:hypothetical protein [Plantibacter sp. VKM Ac-2880]|uniref:hypothetical protein n=1 Tax=Plantibacter sp. VKM Ac-2880 TaxID=2783827 RepID=UPI001E434F31|nr:hypothetical protein [Plantibacter sp. VKM Ac-2880]
MTEVAAPLLEMLWENDDPVKVIAARFGLDDATAAGSWVAATVGEHWGVEVESVTRIVMSGHNALAWISAASGPFLAKWSVLPTKFPRLTALTQLTAWLGEQGLPVSAPVPSLDGRVQVETGERTSMSLQRQITGLLLDVAEPSRSERPGLLSPGCTPPWLTTRAPGTSMRSLVRPSRWRHGSPTGWSPAVRVC